MNKATLLTLVFFAFSFASLAQNDRRGFQGVVTSMAKQTIRTDAKEEASVKTDIEFTGRTINLEGEVYEIIKKTFDGKNQTVFTCTKRRGTFDISYTVGESISVVDTGNKEVVTIYKSLTEK